jgi:hypothetical protein
LPDKDALIASFVWPVYVFSDEDCDDEVSQ